MTRSILVLGANGFIGAALVARLLERTDIKVIGAGRSTRRPTNPRLDYRSVNAIEPQSLAACINDVDVVVNCVAGNEDTLVKSVQTLIEVARLNRPALRIMHLSSMAVYGNASGSVDESAPLNGELGPYAAAKVQAEKALVSHPASVIFRPGCVFGPGSWQWSERFALWLRSRRLGDLGNAGDGCCNLVHVQDVVTAVAQAIDNPATDGAVYNLAMRDPPTWNDYLVKYGLALRAVPVRRITKRKLKIETRLLAPALKITEIAAGKLRLPTKLVPPPIPPSLLRLMSQEIKLDSRHAEKDLGIQWMPLERALEETAAWYSRQG